MKSGIVGLGLTLSAAIFATTAAAADHADASQRAVREFVDAYANRNATALVHATTGDFEVQYGLAQTGTYVAVDEDALVASWRDAEVNSSVRDGHSTVAVYPTSDPNVVFVTYRIPGDAGGERIVLLELRGDRVARARDLVTPAPEFIEFPGWTKDVRTVAAERDAVQGR